VVLVTLEQLRPNPLELIQLFNIEDREKLRREFLRLGGMFLLDCAIDHPAEQLRHGPRIQGSDDLRLAIQKLQLRLILNACQMGERQVL
jgi:hypothetical protein